MAYLICIELGVSFEVINKALQVFPGVPGRLQMYTLKNGAQAFVDFAHKPGAFEEVLKTLRPLSTHLIVVFGCGGNRDKTKRPVMGKLAAAYADLVIITDDNPRDEDRQIIANDIIAGIPLEKMNSIIIELDRKKAITLAAQKSQSHSIIALLGKGHESYYLIKGKKYHHDDIEEIKHF
jgi:UDP-N-acetylmuramoyl-L-alanyl-D-glutamate--2,6-diaminopimelate ligase